MARISVPFSGITSHPNHKDGECSNIVNLRPKNGYLKPVPPRAEHAQLNREYDIVFVHKVGTSEKWIGVAGSTIYTGINTASPQTLERVDGSINSVQQIGNTLSFVTNTTIYYVLWQNEEYKFLGEIPELPVVSFTTEQHEVIKSFNLEYGEAPSASGEKREELAEATKGLVKKALDENKTMFHDAFFIRYALRLYDGSIVMESSPILVMGQENFREWGTAKLTIPKEPRFGTDSHIKLLLYKLRLDYNFSELQDWKDIIKSVDFFTTNYIGLANPEDISKEFYSEGVFNNPPELQYLYPPYYGLWGMVSKKYKSAVELVFDASQYYLYYSDDKFDSRKTPYFPSQVGLTKNFTVTENFYDIIHQEDMPAGSFSHHKIGAKNATVYNNRLRLSNITTSLYNGYPIKQFIWGSKYNGVDLTSGLSSSSTGNKVSVFVDIKTSNGEFIVKEHSTLNVIYFLGAFISYPDPRATKLRVYTQPTYGEYKLVLDVSLTPHPRLNVAYAINSDLKPFITNTSSVVQGSPYYNTKPLNHEPNKLKVSEVNNPFYFPSKNSYQIGSGAILAESSIVMNVTDRNYGMYPVFVFTDNGVFTMAGQTSDSVHDSVQAPTYLEPPISKVIGATPYGVCFVTKRGLMLISQDSTRFLSPQLRENDNEVILRQPKGRLFFGEGSIMDGVAYKMHLSELSLYPGMTYNKFLEEVTNMLYNPYNDELIITSSATDKFSLVYDFPSKGFYLSTEKFQSLVQNTFPDIYVVDRQTVKDYSKSSGSAANISLITRPLYFGTEDTKTLHRMYLRALMYNVQRMSVVGFHSLDGVNFFAFKGSYFGKAGNNYIDFDSGMLSRETYNQYIMLLSGTVDEETQIRYSEYDIEKRYNNDKMR